MNEFINYYLILPIGACAGLSYYLYWLADYEVDDEVSFTWVVYGFLACAVAQGLAIPLGILAGKWKHKLLFQVYIVLMFFIIATLTLNGTMCIIFGNILEEIWRPTTKEYSAIACTKGLTGCSLCNENVNDRCPEWTQEEVVSLVVLDLKIAGISAIIRYVTPCLLLIVVC
jgi:hypothetical protein